MKKFLLYFLLLVSISSCQGQDNSFDGDNKVEFVASTKVPIISGTLNGKEAYFILDSGASLSVLDEEQSSEYDFKTTNSQQQAFGYGGVARFKEVSNANITIGGRVFETDFKAQDLTGLRKLIEEVDGFTISGIIGSDIMKENNFIIDYANSTISIGK